VGVRGGIDLGGTKIQAVVVDDEHHAVRGQARRPTPQSGGPPAVADAMVGTLVEAAAQAGLSTVELLGVGVGSPGEVDTAEGTVARAGNLDNWQAPFALGTALSERLGAPVVLDNDVDSAVLAELELGAGRGVQSFLGVFWGTGVGGGVVLGGHRWHGRGHAGEIGHMVVRRNGARCTCGRRGCMEAYAGRKPMELRARRLQSEGRETRLFEIMEQRGRDTLTSGVWARAVAEGDGLATELIERAVLALGAGIASAVNLLDVERVVLGGGLGLRFGEPMAERISRAMLPHLFVDERPPELLLAQMGDLGGAIGAALHSEHAAARAAT
jgi:glucokinase